MTRSAVDTETARIWGDEVVAPEPVSERDRDALRKREERASSRDLRLPDCVDPARRARCRDPYLFLQTYFPRHFYLKPCNNHREIIAVVSETMLNGGRQALAEPRGTGKTTHLEFLSLWAVFYGVLDSLVYVAASKPEADARLEELKFELQNNDLLLDDFPEFVYPIRALAGNAQRAAGQTVNGELTNIEFTGDSIVFATIDDTAARGQGIVTRGIESGIRGAKHRGVRPQFVLIDDPQTRESAMSLTMCSTRLDIIARDIGMGGDNSRKQAVVALVTIIREGDLADQLTDRDKNPAWNGIRRKLLPQWPERRDLWDRYIAMVREDQAGGDRFYRRAHQFYLDNLDEMNRGAEVAWEQLYFGRHMNYSAILDSSEALGGDGADRQDEREATIRALLGSEVNRFLSDKFRNLDEATIESLRELNVLPDGTEIEASALQHCFNIIAESGMYVFLSECQNEPTDQDADQSRLTADDVAKKTNGLRRDQVPSECEFLVMSVDVHTSHPLYYSVWAFSRSFTGYLIDYGRFPDSDSAGALQKMTGVSSDEGAVYEGLKRLTDKYIAKTYTRDDGVEMTIDLCLIDSKYQTQTVYKFCLQSGQKRVIAPVAGVYISSIGTPLTKAARRKGQRERIGENWRRSPAPGERRVRLTSFDANFWKSFVHARFKTAQGERGCYSLHGRDEKRHRTYGEHVTAERAVLVHSEKRGAVEEWKAIANRDNHYLDNAAVASVGASVLGARFELAEPERKLVKTRAARRTVAVEKQRRKTASERMNERRAERGY